MPVGMGEKDPPAALPQQIFFSRDGQRAAVRKRKGRKIRLAGVVRNPYGVHAPRGPAGRYEGYGARRRCILRRPSRGSQEGFGTAPACRRRRPLPRDQKPREPLFLRRRSGRPKGRLFFRGGLSQVCRQRVGVGGDLGGLCGGARHNGTCSRRRPWRRRRGRRRLRWESCAPGAFAPAGAATGLLSLQRCPLRLPSFFSERADPEAVIHRAPAPSQIKTGGKSPGQVILCFFYGFLQRKAQGQAGGDGRREGAAGPVAVFCGESAFPRTIWGPLPSRAGRRRSPPGGRPLPVQDFCFFQKGLRRLFRPAPLR